MNQYTELFRALSDETRMRIMVLLSGGESCVCQIEEALELSQTKVSRHLTVLRQAGLVKTKRDGVWMYYSLSRPRNCLEEKIFACFKECLRKEEGFKKDMRNMKKCGSNGSDDPERRSKKRKNIKT
jgi:ArsR family transcriptional regulator, arsenate/arsenite/antimonite-responsive transcriptional repressor